MDNTIENKAKFFGLYTGQKVLIRNIDDPQYNDLIVLSEFNYSGWSNPVLYLSPLSSITDEDAIEVAKIACPMLFHTYSKGHIVDRSEKDWLTVKHDRNIKSVDIDFDGYVCVCNEDLNYERNPYVFQAIRKLQELGYYVGYGTEIEYGWVKIKESEVGNG
ncbi:hypothetical protein [Sphingobacterium sp. UBA2074]|nr:hypothetical protein [Sphingobacterium sp. UBA2074]